MIEKTLTTGVRPTFVVEKTLSLAIAACVSIAAGSCASTSHAVAPSTLGSTRPFAALVADLDETGTVIVESVSSASWAVDRSGLINLDHETAKHAGLTDGKEPIEVFFHVIQHPVHGMFVVDTGVERNIKDDPKNAAVQGIVASVMDVESMVVHMPLGAYLDDHKDTPLKGVFLTHLHLDHVMGLPDVPRGTPIYSGPGEAERSELLNAVVAPNIDRAFAGHAALSTWNFTPTEVDAPVVSAIDVFDDGQVWALWMPGHTPGSTMYLVKTPDGPVLLLGDVSHTRWGFENDVEAGSFNADAKEAAVRFHAMKKFVDAHPSITVRLGHQH